MQRAQQVIETSVAGARFSGPTLRTGLLPIFWEAPELNGAFSTAWSELGDATAQHTIMGMVRAVFLIEPVNAAVTSTKFEVRWAQRLAADPRGCSFDECCEVFIALSKELEARARSVRDLLGRFRRFKSIAYEVPVDYADRDAGHVVGNIVWIWDDAEIEHTLLLREQVSNSTMVGAERVAFDLARKKTGVKTFLTDRALTGHHKTNREKRWEAHPESVQFAFRRDCLKIEHKLLSQICHFEGFPEKIRERLAGGEAILSLELPARCPITRDPLGFGTLVESLESPELGRSAFQVGHLNPLKGPGSGARFGHTPANVAWISADGNRIQGHLSYAETLELLDRIAENHKKAGGAPEMAGSGPEV
jgi:hypothetical protein